MKHLGCVSKETPACAVVTPTIFDKEGGLFGFRELGDIVITVARFAQTFLGPLLPSHFQAG
jgi:hypothetical protein